MSPSDTIPLDQPPPVKKRRPGRWFFFTALLFLLPAIAALVLYVGYLDKTIRKKFDGKRWALPAVVYARPLELYPGFTLTPTMLEEELQIAGYRRDKTASAPGGYVLTGQTMHLVTRDFTYADSREPSLPVTVEFDGQRITRLSRSGSGEELPLVRLDPARIGSFHPLENEDRVLVERHELPELLVQTLLTVEDQHFFSHTGIDPQGILRAALANLRAGRTVQGGSTLTQQLVKNFYLNNERTLQRKVNEVIMALLLELHYTKDEILTAYANEIYLGQDRGRAIHGFGLASQFYFRRELQDLSPAQIALLVGLIKGPSVYDPRKDRERCLQRRQVVLDLMRDRGVIGDDLYLQAKAAGLEQAETVQSGFNRYPAFLDLVRRQLGQEYHEEDLVSSGLKIFTTLDPQVQQQVEKQLRETMPILEKRSGRKQLEAAVIVSTREGGEILAMAGGRDPRQSGFNRALDARRPIGSLIKPVIYLSALAKGYTLASQVEDTAITISAAGTKDWHPSNYDRREHGLVPLYEALANSYNLATIRIGLDTGVDAIIASLRKMGIEQGFQPYPSFLLGTAELTPLEVARIYQVFAAEGFYQPQRAIRTVLTASDNVVQRFGLEVEQRFPAEDIFLINTALQGVVRHGTARSLTRYLPESVQAAGKTGTTDELRDSWFAGFTGDRLAVAWVGKDDNKPTGLTGATGAMVLWGRIMGSLPQEPLQLSQPENMQLAAVPFHSGDGQYNELPLPFVANSSPAPAIPHPPAPEEQKKEEVHANPWNIIRGWFE